MNILMPWTIKIYHIKTCLVIAFYLLSSALICQNDQSNEAKKKARISLDYFNYNNYGPRLKTTVKSKEDRSYVGVRGVRVDFFIEDDQNSDYLGFAITDKSGAINYGLPDTFYKAIDTSNYYRFLAKIEDNKYVLDASKIIDITRSKIKLTTQEEDSIRSIQFLVERPGPEGQLIPAVDVEVGIYVKRLFGLMSIAESEYTDENGIVSFIFPNDIRSDTSGNVLIYAKVEDHEEFGTLIGTSTTDWGVSNPSSTIHLERELWSAGSNAPISLVLTISLLILIVWGFILFLIYEVFQIRRLGQL